MGSTNPPTGTYTYVAGTKADITALPNANYVLAYWWVDGTTAYYPEVSNPQLSNNGNTLLLTMDQNHSVKPFFKTNPSSTVAPSATPTATPLPPIPETPTSAILMMLFTIGLAILLLSTRTIGKMQFKNRNSLHR
jgi:hypothetical protein